MEKVDMQKTQSEYKTKDLAEAGFLLTSNAVLNRVEREGRTCWFVFRDKSLCEDLAYQFWFSNAKVGAKAFYDALQLLKNRIFAT